MRKRKKHDCPHTTVESGQAAMTWTEIGEALGFDKLVARRNAYMIFKRAMQKIRDRPEACARFRELVEFRKSQRKETIWPDWGASHEEKTQAKRIRGRDGDRAVQEGVR